MNNSIKNQLDIYAPSDLVDVLNTQGQFIALFEHYINANSGFLCSFKTIGTPPTIKEDRLSHLPRISDPRVHLYF